MMRLRRRITLGLAGLLLVVGSSLTIEPAHASGAASLDDRGWWWRAQSNPDLLLPAPPTVAPGQLLVQGAPDGAVAISALAATLAEGDAHAVLTLQVAANGDTGGSGAVLLACQAGTAWIGGDAKPWPEKPNAACPSGGVTGERSADGRSWRFDLGALQFNDKVNVVLVPGTVEGQPEGADGSVFSLTFDAPTAASVQGSPGTPPPPPASPPMDPGASPPGDGGSVGFAPPVFDAGGVTLPPVDAALPDADQGLTPVAPSVQEGTPLLPASVPVDPRSPHARAVGVLLLLLGAGAVYMTSRQQPLIGPEGIPGGLGRWERPRWGTPPSLRG